MRVATLIIFAVAHMVACNIVAGDKVREIDVVIAGAVNAPCSFRALPTTKLSELIKAAGGLEVPFGSARKISVIHCSENIGDENTPPSGTGPDHRFTIRDLLFDAGVDPSVAEMGLQSRDIVYLRRKRPLEIPREQDGAGQPATRPEPKSEGSDKTQPEAEGRSR
jgi:hypothetical protein